MESCLNVEVNFASGNYANNSQKSPSAKSSTVSAPAKCSPGDGLRRRVLAGLALSFNIIVANAATLSISANPASVTSGASSTVTWISTEATGCAASGAWSGVKAISGSQSVGPINADSTYVLVCSGVSGSTSRSVTVRVGGLDPAAPPSGNFDLSRWKLTIPSGTDISVATLNSGYTLVDAFYTDPVSGGMVFRCPNIAGTTSGSTYSRSELREMLNASAGTTNLGNNWVLGTSSASARAAAAGIDGTMNATLSVDHVSTSGDSAKIGRVIVGQIHGPNTEIIRLYYHKRPSDLKGAIYFGHDTPSNSNTYHPIIGGPDSLDPIDGISLGERWSYEIKVVGQTLTVRVFPENRPSVTRTLAIESGYNDQYLYYKAGVYNQNNTGDSADYVQATFYSLTHTHP